jgi:hypothetical protein
MTMQVKMFVPDMYPVGYAFRVDFHVRYEGELAPLQYNYIVVTDDAKKCGEIVETYVKSRFNGVVSVEVDAVEQAPNILYEEVNPCSRN